MDLVGLAGDHILALCDRVGPGIKSMLMDSATMGAVSICCPQSTLMRKGVYLFERLDLVSGHAHRDKQLRFVTCVCVLRPTADNLHLLAKELQAPRFGKYHIYATGRMSHTAIRQLAASDLSESVVAIGEMALDFCPRDAHIFTTHEPCEAAGLVSMVDALGVSVDATRICYSKGSRRCESFAKDVERALISSAGGGSSEAVLFVFDRGCDPVTPLLNQWTYQAMIHELFGIHNNMVDLTMCDVSPELKKIVLTSHDDDFFKMNMYKNFGDIGILIKKLVGEFQDHMQNQKRIDSITDIKDFISTYPEFKKMSGTVSKHVSLLSELSRLVSAHSLLQVSEVEQNLCCDSGGRVEVAAIRELLQLPGLRLIDAKRLLCLLNARLGSREVTMEERDLVNATAKKFNVDSACLYGLINKYRKACAHKSDKLFGDTKLLTTKKLLQGLRGIENVYTQHQSLLRALLLEMVRQRRVEDVHYPAGFSFTSRFIVHVLGGYTYEEVRDVYQINKDNGCNVTLGGCSILRSEDIINELS